MYHLLGFLCLVFGWALLGFSVVFSFGLGLWLSTAVFIVGSCSFIKAIHDSVSVNLGRK